MQLHDVWFLLIAVLWTGYLVLEGFDFGVGMLTRFVARDNGERRVLLNTIGPVWDVNEVWVLTAGGATFAAFPDWYATLFSAGYLPLFVIIVALILRNLAFEYRHQRDSAAWRRGWDLCVFWGSLLPALLWGVVLANVGRGLPIDSEREFTGSVLDLLHPFALLGGVMTLTLCLFHGAVFLALRTEGSVRRRSRRAASVLGVAALAVLVAFLAWLVGQHTKVSVVLAALLAVACLGTAFVLATRGRRNGWAFALSSGAVTAVVAAMFLALYPRVLPSTLSAQWSLTVDNASASPYTLRFMTWVAVVMLPFVLLYQLWTYWVFRHRLGVRHLPVALRRRSPAPADPGPAGGP
ncbi:cytochrome d ubiquinol oxidase subunit II [Streptomyces sp. NPDC002506]|uniref:cytochrome d ubiquinol oxidase subunit II n=1 Tax=Streptomyces sp. NPDC002506 TaxID=3154536 RepID=UPI003333F0AB